MSQRHATAPGPRTTKPCRSGVAFRPRQRLGSALRTSKRLQRFAGARRLGGCRSRWGRTGSTGRRRWLRSSTTPSRGTSWCCCWTGHQLAAIDSLAGGPVLGLFASGYMTTKYQPLIATAAGSGSITYRRLPNSRGDEPTLAEMTSTALQLVDNPNGFFMQVESAQTGKGAHDGNICGSLGQVSEADKALEVLLEYQRTHPDTLIVVTADHGDATQIVRPGEAKAYGTLQTADGDPIRIG
ncbi:alkaline phosphatase [Solirubrobacter phytolaccae]|uniref:Alkaline phosphatase n=1 Tax=Solirubrobacter phytolaccae TaxID=1404360 RepID=A0A9X3N6Q2_9ACTN|nr:alkaline phosphatase [Solirubrobacter phytolaccae]MDA0178751.1 alkaline phosphatase [Solirubrobacter phytolaccae]